jgi:CheY-like chemotaxis protein
MCRRLREECAGILSSRTANALTRRFYTEYRYQGFPDGGRKLRPDRLAQKQSGIQMAKKLSSRSRGTAMMVRVLIADDHAIVRSGLRAILETRSDFAVCAEAQDGQEAIDLTIQYKPDIAVIDFSLPVLDGIEATRQIRLKSPQTEVLVLTANDDELLISKALLVGARGFLLKMEANDQILEAVTRLARHPSIVPSG